jgi:hypothetical protein
MSNFDASAAFRLVGRGMNRLAHRIRLLVFNYPSTSISTNTTSPSSSSSNVVGHPALPVAAALGPLQQNPPGSIPDANRKPGSSDGKAAQPVPVQSEVPPKKAKNKRPESRLMSLPPEIQLMIVRKLEFGDVEQLRRTCKFYRTFISPKTVRELFRPYFKTTLLAHCYLCLKHDPSKTGLLWADYNDRRYPLASKCIHCAVQREELTVGKKVALANYASVWVCRWCGYPVSIDSAWNQPEFHRKCYNRYNDVLLVYFALGWIQFSLVVVGGALLWRYFRDERMILISSIVSGSFIPRCLDRTLWLWGLLMEAADQLHHCHLAHHHAHLPGCQDPDVSLDRLGRDYQSRPLGDTSVCDLYAHTKHPGRSHREEHDRDPGVLRSKHVGSILVMFLYLPWMLT